MTDHATNLHLSAVNDSAIYNAHARPLVLRIAEARAAGSPIDEAAAWRDLARRAASLLYRPHRGDGYPTGEEMDEAARRIADHYAEQIAEETGKARGRDAYAAGKRYLIRTDSGFCGYPQSALKADGTVGWSGGADLDSYLAASPHPLRLVTPKEAEKAAIAWSESHITEPREEDDSAWDYALGVLPPCRWRTVRGVELFHVSEPLAFDLVEWHGRIGSRCFVFRDRAGADLEALAAKVARAADLARAG